MSNTQLTAFVTEANCTDVLTEIEDAFFDIPFENSHFQTEMFVIASQITPARAYRSIGLRMHSKLEALNEARFSRMRTEIDILELKEQLEGDELSKWDRRRKEIDLAQKESGFRFANKLANDALAELNVLYGHFKALPKYTREQFEMEEEFHFTQRLNRQVQGIQGASESLTNMGMDHAMIANFQQAYVALSPAEQQSTSLQNLLARVVTDTVAAMEQAEKEQQFLQLAGSSS